MMSKHDLIYIVVKKNRIVTTLLEIFIKKNKFNDVYRKRTLGENNVILK